MSFNNKQAYNAYMREYMLKRYHERRLWAILYLGQHCVNCGSTENLEIDHIIPENKSRKDKFGRMWNMNIISFYKELDKCQLLCHDCHILKTTDDLGVPHGLGVSGKKNCLCSVCKIKKANYMKQYLETHTRKRDLV